MSRLPVLLTLVALTGFVLATAGCGRQSPSAQPSSPPGAGDIAGTDKHDHDAEHGGHMHEHQHADHARPQGRDAHREALAKLSEADRALAEKQAVCPVSGAPLGSMGTPPKIAVKGHEVFLCCAGCAPEIEKNPDKYLAKLFAPE